MIVKPSLPPLKVVKSSPSISSVAEEGIRETETQKEEKVEGEAIPVAPDPATSALDQSTPRLAENTPVVSSKISNDNSHSNNNTTYLINNSNSGSQAASAPSSPFSQLVENPDEVFLSKGM